MTVLSGNALRARTRRVRWLRHAVQGFALALVALVGWEFAAWVRGLESGRFTHARPPGVEAFLPISALLGVRHLWETGRVDPIHPAGLVILAAIVGVSVLLKKSFCSWICPVGTLSEAVAALGPRWSLPRLLDVPLRGLKYVLLLFFAHAVFVAMTAEQVRAFLASPFNVTADVRMLYFFERLSPLGLKVLGGLVVASVLVPYAWCRYLCPYGALLGAASLLAPVKIARRTPECIDCGLCTRACPARLPVAELRRVRSDECTSCLSCVAACPVPTALQPETPWRARVRPRVFAAVLVVVFFGALGIARTVGPWASGIADEVYAEVLREPVEHP